MWIEVERGFGTPCHIWEGARSGYYGWDSENRTFIHRTYWIEANGPIPDRTHIHHLCGSKRCVNVEHMELRSPEEHRLIHAKSARKPSRLTDEDVTLIRSDTFSLSELQEVYGMSRTYLALVRTGKAPKR